MIAFIVDAIKRGMYLLCTALNQRNLPTTREKSAASQLSYGQEGETSIELLRLALQSFALEL